MNPPCRLLRLLLCTLADSTSLLLPADPHPGGADIFATFKELEGKHIKRGFHAGTGRICSQPRVGLLQILLPKRKCNPHCLPCGSGHTNSSRQYDDVSIQKAAMQNREALIRTHVHNRSTQPTAPCFRHLQPLDPQDQLHPSHPSSLPFVSGANISTRR